ncbi:MAG: hypothetical protein IJ268_08055 [Proteobacteria bacterium]|nr:hypothetical protein [Pseudomonadota bacterium]
MDAAIAASAGREPIETVRTNAFCDVQRNVYNVWIAIIFLQSSMHESDSDHAFSTSSVEMCVVCRVYFKAGALRLSALKYAAFLRYPDVIGIRAESSCVFA